MSEDAIKEHFNSVDKTIEIHEKRLNNLEKTYAIMEKMEYRMEQMEKSVTAINNKLDNQSAEKGKNVILEFEVILERKLSYSGSIFFWKEKDLVCIESFRSSGIKIISAPENDSSETVSLYRFRLSTNMKFM